MVIATCPQLRAAQTASPRPTEHCSDDIQQWRESQRNQFNPATQTLKLCATKESQYIQEGAKEDLQCIARRHELHLMDVGENIRLEGILQALETGSQIAPSVEELTAILHKCRKEKNDTSATWIHSYMRRHGLESHDVLGNHLVQMLVETGKIDDAQRVFSKLRSPNQVSWNYLIAGCVRFGKPELALSLYHELEKSVSTFLDGYTYGPILKACTDLKDFQTGCRVHAIVDEIGLLATDVFVGNTLIDMYARWGFLHKAQAVFDTLAAKDLVSWNTLLAGYAQHMHGEKAFRCFNQMKSQGFSPDPITFVIMLKACNNVHKGREMHAEIVKFGFFDVNLHVGNALVNMYARYGFLPEAQDVFDILPVQDKVSWNALITGYAEHNYGEEALFCFERMASQGIPTDAITYVCSLKACGCMGFADNGRGLHADIVKRGFLEQDLHAGSALVDMYAKCGSLAEAQEVFDHLSAIDVVCWSALIAGYAQVGEVDVVFSKFDSMIAQGVKPNEVTFVSVLSACCHAGLVGMSEHYFETMSREYNITPTLLQMTCVVDLLCRVGQLDNAVVLIERMPSALDLAMWHTILGAAQQVHNWKVGKQAFKQAMQLEGKSSLTYVNMSNMLGTED